MLLHIECFVKQSLKIYVHVVDVTVQRIITDIYERKSLNNRNFILKCMEKYAQ